MPSVLGSLLLLAGCGGDPERSGVASARTGGAAPATGAASDVVTEYVESVREFVACVRKEGLKVTDPDGKGRFTFEGDLRILKADPKFAAAQKKCSALLPPVPKELREKPVRTAEEIETAREYAKCMRANGAPDFPDPGPDGWFPEDAEGEPLPWDQTSEGAQRAGRTCGPIIGAPTDPGPGQG
ncbi:hypothetical protein GCM10009682_17310 [Luedemannella flava]|uniref:Lipoprotein n=1 Tax=Luedemannella flava TaxID=349316 RepID=A0ABP4XVF2_9ACTN